MRLRLPAVVVTATVFAAALAACDDLATQPGRNHSTPSRQVSANSSPSLMYCPRATKAVSSDDIGPEGGRLTAAAFTLVIPAGALPDTERVTLTRPASDYLEVDAKVGSY